jgi:hypothetical protein
LLSCRLHNKFKLPSFLVPKHITKFADPEIIDLVLQAKIMSNEDEVDSEKLATEIESPDLEKLTEESALVEDKSDTATTVISGVGEIEETDIANMESSVETASVTEEKIPQGLETYEEPSDKHIVGEVCFLSSITPINILTSWVSDLNQFGMD